MIRIFMVLSTVTFLFLISVSESKAQSGGCPCNLDAVPKTSACWGEEAEWVTGQDEDEFCAVFDDVGDAQVVLLVQQEGGGRENLLRIPTGERLR